MDLRHIAQATCDNLVHYLTYQAYRVIAEQLSLPASEMVVCGLSLGWADPAARAGFAHGPMLWQAALELRARGVRWIDLGAVDAANPGLARFKLGTGAALRALGPTCWVLP